MKTAPPEVKAAMVQLLADFLKKFEALAALACLSQLGRLAAGKPFRISGGVQKVSTTKWIGARRESS